VARTGAVPQAGPEQVRPALAAWLAGRTGDPGPFRLRPLAGGNSNETAELTSPTGRWVLRRPPATLTSPRSNDLSREFRILDALAGQRVRAPRAIAYTDDRSVSPVSCLVMEHVEGVALKDAWPSRWRPGPDTIGLLGHSAVEALADLHRVDWRARGLEDFGRPAGYLARQVARWRSQYELNQVRDLPLFERVGDWLEGNRPQETEPAIIHGDFHLDNMLAVAEPRPRVAAIIDWELSTIGDPLVDLGLLLAFWGTDRTDPPAMPAIQGLSRLPSAPGRCELADHYSELTGRSTEALHFYMALAFFKLAAIVEGAYARFLAGDRDSDYARALADDVPRLLADAARFADIL
jgi:aminoglycoside phosphotransferase (APT) family kinase protein